MSNKPVDTRDSVVADLLAQLIKKAQEPMQLKGDEIATSVKYVPLAANAATEKTLAEILNKLSGILVVDNSNSVQPVSVKDAKLAPDAARDTTLQKIIELLSESPKTLEKIKVSGMVSVDNFPTAPAVISVDNFPVEQSVRVNSSVLPANAASETTLKTISEKIQDKVEVKGKVEIKASVLPDNAASESTLAEIKSMVAQLLALEIQEERAPEYFTAEQAALGIDVQNAKFVSVQVDDSDNSVVKIKGSNTNEQYHTVNEFTYPQICTIEPKFKYLKVEAAKAAKLIVVVFYN